MEVKMLITFDISPELDLIIYACTGTFTATDFFKVTDIAALDPRLKNKMKIIIDIFHAELEVALHDLQLAITKNKELQQKGFELGKAAVLTKSSGLNFLGDALKLMSSDAPSNFGVFNNKYDAIHWLGLPEKEVDLFWGQVTVNASQKTAQLQAYAR